MKKVIVLALVTGSLLFNATASAQGRGAQGRPVEVLNMLDAYALVQAQNALNLSDDRYGDFVGRLKKLQQTRRRLQQERNALLGELRRLTNPGVQQLDEAAVRDRLRQLREHDARAAAAMTTVYEGLDEVLDLRQQARFRIFEEQIERRKLDLLMRARRNAGGRGQ
jgi:DNA repair ATPase RecN